MNRTNIFFSRIIVFIAAVCSLVCGCTSGSAQETPLPKNTPQITPAPIPTGAVSEFPTCTAPAITDAPNHDNDSETVLTAEQISAMNAAFLQFPGESAGLFDLASFKNGISAKRLKALIARGNLPSANGYVGQTPLSAQQRNEILNNRALDAVRNNSDVRFGFCVQRSDLRSVPFAQRVTSKPNDRFGDTLQESVVLQNEPLAVLHESADGKFLFVAAYFYVGWINSDSVALCSSFEQWQALLAPENDFLVVTGSSFRLCRDPYEPLVSELELTMGMRLSLAEKPGTVKSVRGRMSYDNYIVNVPSRAADGSLKFIEALVPISRDVHIGYLPFTYSNVIRLADKTRGEIYGWGGMLDARDCSALVMEIYRCFGIMLPRNTSDLAMLPEKYAADVSSLSAEAKRETILSQPAGVILFFPGHVMIYYGSDGNDLLCLSAAGKFAPVQSSATQNVYTVEVCSLDVRLSNGKTWLEAVEKIIRIG